MRIKFYSDSNLELFLDDAEAGMYNVSEVDRESGIVECEDDPFLESMAHDYSGDLLDD